jgi:hypothetical protein
MSLRKGVHMRAAKLLVVFPLVVLLGATVASADPVQLFSSLGADPNHPAGQSFFGFDFGEEGDPDSRFARAMSFMPSTTADLSALELALQFPFSFSAGALQINLFDSDGMLPGSVLESWTGTSQTGMGIFRFDSSLHPVLTAGRTYWVEATTTGQADGLWAFSDDPPQTTVDVRRNNNGPWDVGTRSFKTTAFRVTGDPSASPTPEPASLVLLGTGAVLAGWRGRRQRQD